ncbi:MAG: Endo,4-beta-xylanase [Acidobacteriaceae bacterium]|nr:Endo,4-beta-xylanase [Acidobacteriaceae bacterium]
MNGSSSRRRFLSLLGSTALAEAASATVRAAENVALAAEQTLRDLAAQKGLHYGCATTQDALSKDPQFASLVAQQCDLLVPENALNWKYVEPRQGEFNFRSGDWMFNFAQSHKMKFGGGTLVWHQGLPAWFNNLSQQAGQTVMVNHIRQTVSHYQGRAYSWAVVNEAIAFKEEQAELKDTPFLRIIGPKYIETAFLTAAEADPAALLVYNDNHLEYDVDEDNYRRPSLLRLLKRWIGEKVPIGALGIQSHLRTGGAPFNAGKLRDFLRAVADLGLKIVVSELDVMEKGTETQAADRDAAIARELERYLSVVLQERAVVSVATWGLSARYTWLADYAPRADGKRVHPLPYDEDLRPTRAWQAMATAFANAPRRS